MTATDVGEGRWDAVGSIHHIPIAEVSGLLYLCGLDVVGPDPAAALDHVGANTVVCLQMPYELARRYPEYEVWLGAPEPHRAIHHPVEDHSVSSDAEMSAVAHEVSDLLADGESVIAHCGAGWGRAGMLAILVMVANGRSVIDATAELRLARPAAGPQSVEQFEQLARLAPSPGEGQ